MVAIGYVSQHYQVISVLLPWYDESKLPFSNSLLFYIHFFKVQFDVLFNLIKPVLCIGASKTTVFP